jgi:putative inorganic carbon (hco3(-)) transporter
MGSVITLASLVIAGLAAIFAPWVGIAAAYLIGILNPQAIWWWVFEDLRPVYWVLLPTLLGATIKGLRGRIIWADLNNTRIFCLLMIWLSGMVSWWLAPYSVTVATDSELGIRGAGFIVENLSKIILLVLVGTLFVKSAKQISLMAIVMLIAGLYLTWWVNDRYLFQGAGGRIGGPISIDGSGVYSDENLFGTLFVVVFPFAWYAAFAVKKIWLKWVFLLAVPFIWHGVFLTGSRGALLGLGAAMLIIALRMKSRSLGLGLIVLFVVAFAWQAGDTMKERAAGIDAYSEDSSATGRLDAWEVGARMMFANPLTGVGPGAFLRAFPDYSPRLPLQAHNTFVQFGAEFGLIAFVAVAVMLGSCIRSLWRIRAAGGLRQPTVVDNNLFVREATLAAVIGLTVSALFLSLQLFEVMYFLVFMTNVLVAQHQTTSSQQSHSLAPINKQQPDDSILGVMLPARRDGQSRPND